MSFRTVKEKKIPEWLNVSNYSEATELNIHQWSIELCWRSQWLNHGIYGDPKKKVKVGALEELKKNISNLGKTYFDSHTLQDKEHYSLEEDYYNLSSSSVTPLTYPLLNRAIADIKSISGKNLEQLIKRNEDVPIKEMLTHPLHAPIEMLLDHPEDGSYLHVGTHVPDEVIINDFKKWLSFRRKHHNEKFREKSFSKQDFDDWSEKKMLPYIDLLIWQDITSTKLTLTEIGEHLYGNYTSVNVSDRIRHTVRPLSKTLLDDQTTLMLQLQCIGQGLEETE